MVDCKPAALFDLALPPADVLGLGPAFSPRLLSGTSPDHEKAGGHPHPPHHNHNHNHNQAPRPGGGGGGGESKGKPITAGSGREEGPLVIHSGPPEIQPHEIKYLEKIGSGCFGEVHRGKCRGIDVAVKRLTRQDLDEKTLSDFKKEVEIMSKLNHPNVVLFMGACTTPGHMAIVTELMPKGNYAQLLHDPKVDLSLQRRMKMAKDAALGMNWLHESNPCILHRDMKPQNLLIDKDLNVKVCDFGLSVVKPRGEVLRDKDSIPGTPLWMSPEVLQGKDVDEKSDVYSYGIVLWVGTDC